eukprot:CAMPEP_0184491534 /NCGR_PEP_ID=MMETSP0113_2-20130426/20638_1 /TAXON_ID=91329 /ORGANISM="Norrisiella sphaerica, Strain BC52" /LENGTH=301 /DNA_ID=CAMNT_0026875943 /DNA_START=202 /DNA_END=1107 /DNA_ORIENTATION=+
MSEVAVSLQSPGPSVSEAPVEEEREPATNEQGVVPEEFLERVVKMKKEIVKYLDDNAKTMRANVTDKTKWVEVLDRYGVKVFSPKDKVNTHAELLTVTEHPRSPLEVFSFIRDFANRTHWDCNVSKHVRLKKLYIDEKTDLGYDITYTRTQPIAGGIVTARSFVNLRMGEHCSKSGSFVESVASVDQFLNEEDVPERTDYSTGATMFFGSGGLFEPINGGKHCRITYLTLTDPRGWLPHTVVNQIMPGELAGYFNLIKTVMDSKKYEYKLIPLGTPKGAAREGKEERKSTKFDDVIVQKSS